MISNLAERVCGGGFSSTGLSKGAGKAFSSEIAESEGVIGSKWRHSWAIELPFLLFLENGHILLQ